MRLPEGCATSCAAGFGEFTIHTDAGRTVLSHLPLDQAALRALLCLLWDVGSEVCLVIANPEETTQEQR